MEKIKLTKKFLIKQYIKNKKSMQQIARETGYVYSSIWNNLKKYNIPIRTISEAKKGTKRPDTIKRNKLRDNKGSKNGNFKDGRTMKKYYCNYSNCNNEISLYSALYGDGKCQHHALKGIKHTKEHNKKITKKLKGLFSKEKHWNWKGGITTLQISIRNLLEYVNWRNLIFKRDNYTCQECGICNGQGKSIYLEAHHIKPFAKLLLEFLKEYDQFSPIEDKETLVRLAIKYKPFWNTDNGKTLCKDCHNLTKNKGI